jgi:phosphomannomutase
MVQRSGFPLDVTMYFCRLTKNEVMSLIKSISGIRGTIGGRAGEGLSPLDAVKFTAAYAHFIKNRSGVSRPKVIVGRDARISGEMVNRLVTGNPDGLRH